MHNRPDNLAIRDKIEEEIAETALSAQQRRHTAPEPRKDTQSESGFSEKYYSEAAKTDYKEEKKVKELLDRLRLEIKWEGRVKDVIDRLKMIRLTDYIFKNAVPSMKAQYIYFSIDQENKPGLRTLAEEMEKYFGKLEKEEKQGIKQTWEEFIEEIRDLVQKYGRRIAYEMPTLQECGSWEAWIWKFMMDVYFKRTTLNELKEAIDCTPQKYPTGWEEIDFTQEEEKICKELVEFADKRNINSYEKIKQAVSKPILQHAKKEKKKIAEKKHCSYCRKKGHLESDCYIKKEEGEKKIVDKMEISKPAPWQMKLNMDNLSKIGQFDSNVTDVSVKSQKMHNTFKQKEELHLEGATCDKFETKGQGNRIWG